MKLFHLLEQELSTPSEHIKKETVCNTVTEKTEQDEKKEVPAALYAEQLSLPGSRQNGFSGSQGLSSAEAARRLKKDGLNILSSEKKVSAAKIFAGQFKDFLTLILLAGTAISLFMGEYTEALTIAVIILMNAILGFAQEFKTEKTLEALKKMAAPHARVYRDGKLTSLPAAELAEGDIVEIETGDRVPADLLILESRSLESDEAMLTGESLPTEKHADPDAADFRGHDKAYMLYMGCVVTKGHCRGRVVATGMRTQMGQIADMLVHIEDEQTPLQKRLGELGKYIAIGCLVICAIVSLTGILRGEAPFDMLITGLSLSVAAVPEGLPAIVTIALALAVNRMIKRKSLIRRLHAVETLGCASVICSDKTGTLTENKMTVRQISGIDYSFTVSGSGYEKDGDFKENGAHADPLLHPAANLLLEASVLCSNSKIVSSGKNKENRSKTADKIKTVWDVQGDPTETALLIMAAKAGITAERMEKTYTRLDELPFDSKRKCMSVVVRSSSGKRFLFTKGGYDILLPKCLYIQCRSGVRTLDDGLRQEIDRENERMASQALRVLGIAFRELSDTEEHPKEENLIFLGLAGMIDPPRPEAKQAVTLCKKAGIKTVMITGDHKLTAEAIAAMLGIYRAGDRIVTGRELDRMGDDELTAAIGKTTVFARVNPSHKLRIVRAFKRTGQVVAMTGDGVNDAPAVKEADIGVAMGNGTDVTKEASDVVLLDSNFASLVAAVEEGRTIYSNIRKFIRYLLACNIGEVLTMFLGMLMGFPVVLLPIHILLINLVTDGLPAIALGLEPKEANVMEQKPRRADAGIFSDGLLFQIVFRGVLIGLTTLMVFASIFRLSGSLDTARTAAFVTLVFTQLVHVFECKSEEKTLFSVPYFNNWKLIFAVLTSLTVILCAVYLPALQPILSTVSLSGRMMGVVLGYTLAVPVVYAAAKSIARYLKNRKFLNRTEKQ